MAKMKTKRTRLKALGKAVNSDISTADFNNFRPKTLLNQQK